MSPIMRLWCFIASLGLICSGQAWAAEAVLPHLDRAAVERFMRDRGADARTLLFGAPRPQASAPTDLDCSALYDRRVTLMRGQVDYDNTGFWDDPRNQAGVFVGAVWTPAFYYLPFRALAQFTAATHVSQVQADLDALRTQAAAQRCFEP